MNVSIDKLMLDDPNHRTHIYKLSDSSYRISHILINDKFNEVILIVRKVGFLCNHYECDVRLMCSCKKYKVSNPKEVYHYAETMCEPELVIRDGEQSTIESILTC